MRRQIAAFISILLLSNLFHPVLASKDATEYYAILVEMGKNGMELYHALLQHHNWKEDNIILLANKNATYDNISKAFDNISSIADENDYIFIFYSGRGIKLKDDDGDEKDGYDEAWMIQNGNISDDWLREKIGKIKANAISIFMDCDFGNGMAEDLKGNKRIIFSRYGITPFHIPTKFLIYSIKNGRNASFEKVYRAIKTANNVLWLSLPIVATIFSTFLTIVPVIVSNFLLNMVRSIVQFAIDGIVGGVAPLMYFIFFLITLKIYLPVFVALNGMIVANTISFMELYAFIRKGGFIFPFCNVYDGCDGDIPFLKD